MYRTVKIQSERLARMVETYIWEEMWWLLAFTRRWLLQWGSKGLFNIRKIQNPNPRRWKSKRFVGPDGGSWYVNFHVAPRFPKKRLLRASKWLRKFRTRKIAKSSKLLKLLESCFEPVGKGGWPPISTWIKDNVLYLILSVRHTATTKGYKIHYLGLHYHYSYNSYL